MAGILKKRDNIMTYHMKQTKV